MNETIRIVQTNKAFFPLIGGVETIVANLAYGLSSRNDIGVEILVCNNVPSLWKTQKVFHGVPVTYVPMWMKIASLPISPSYPFHLSRMKGDILHIHDPFPLADLSVVMLRKIRNNFSRIVVSWHSDIVRQKWILSPYSSIIHRFLEKVDSIVVATPNHIESSQFLPSYKDKCVVIPYGLQLGWVNDREGRSEQVKSIRKKFGTPLLLSVGRLVYYKGFRYLIDAVQMLPDVKLIIIGSGPLYSDLQKQIINLGLEKRVTILPHVLNSELYAFYDACDVFILPSTEVSEAFGLVQVEAMACGKPVVSTRLGTGVTFVNQHGVTGLTVPPRDTNALGGALGTLLNDPDLRSSLGRNAKRRALQEFTEEKMIESTMTLYKRLLSL